MRPPTTLDEAAARREIGVKRTSSFNLAQAPLWSDIAELDYAKEASTMLLLSTSHHGGCKARRASRNSPICLYASDARTSSPISAPKIQTGKTVTRTVPISLWAGICSAASDQAICGPG